MTKTIYVYLKNEGIDCWRPVEAIQQGELFRIISERDKTDEEWEFDTDSLVKCQLKTFQDGKQGLAAIERVII